MNTPGPPLTVRKKKFHSPHLRRPRLDLWRKLTPESRVGCHLQCDLHCGTFSLFPHSYHRYRHDVLLQRIVALLWGYVLFGFGFKGPQTLASRSGCGYQRDEIVMTVGGQK